MMPMKGPQGTPAPPLVAYCERHLPPDQAAAREASLEAEAVRGAIERPASAEPGSLGFSERARAGTALGPVVADNCGVRTAGERLLTDELEFGRCVGAI